MRSLLLAAMASIGLVGCVGDLQVDQGGTPSGGGGNVPDPGGGTNPNPVQNSKARMMFEQNVYPIISGASGGMANCKSCHGTTPVGNVTAFVADDVTSAYATATSFQAVVGNFTPTTAGILTKIQPGPHNGQVYSAAQQKSITDWLAQEVIERNSTGGTGTGSGGGTTGPSPGDVTQKLLSDWSACMSLANWQTAKMTTAWGNMQANNGSACRSCHDGGGYGMYISNQETPFFTTISSNKFYMLQYFTVQLGAPPYDQAKVIVNQDSFKGVSQGQPPHLEHPQFNATNNQGMTALQQFYTLTAAAVAANGTTPCGPPKLTN